MSRTTRSQKGSPARGEPKDASIPPKEARQTSKPSRKILQANTMEAVAEYIQKTSPTKIIVLTGAGISTAAGIPDFRTPGTGLYDNLQQYDLPYAEAIFDIDYFRRKPEPFYALAKALYPGNFTPTLSHYFIRMLADQGILLRQYTQNIDTLERRAGMLDEWLVEAHGSFHEAVCVDCGHVIPSQDADGSDAVREAIFADTIPRCAQCSGIVKPKIVFFGEGLPLTYFSRMNEDFDKCDLLLVMGTSLKVQPFASLIDRVPNHVPRLLINLERCGEGGRMSGFDFSGKKHKFQRDAFWSGRCDDGCLELAKLLGMERLLLDTMDREHHLLAKKDGLISPEEEEEEEEARLIEKVAQLTVSDTKGPSSEGGDQKDDVGKDASSTKTASTTEEEDVHLGKDREDADSKATEKDGVLTEMKEQTSVSSVNPPIQGTKKDQDENAADDKKEDTEMSKGYALS